MINEKEKRQSDYLYLMIEFPTVTRFEKQVRYSFANRILNEYHSIHIF